MRELRPTEVQASPALLASGADAFPEHRARAAEVCEVGVRRRELVHDGRSMLQEQDRRNRARIEVRRQDVSVVALDHEAPDRIEERPRLHRHPELSAGRTMEAPETAVSRLQIWLAADDQALAPRAFDGAARPFAQPAEDHVLRCGQRDHVAISDPVPGARVAAELPANLDRLQAVLSAMAVEGGSERVCRSTIVGQRCAGVGERNRYPATTAQASADVESGAGGTNTPVFVAKAEHARGKSVGARDDRDP